MKKLIILILFSLLVFIPSSHVYSQDKTLVVGIMSNVLSLDPANHRDRVDRDRASEHVRRSGDPDTRR